MRRIHKDPHPASCMSGRLAGEESGREALRLYIYYIYVYIITQGLPGFSGTDRGLIQPIFM